MRGAWLESRGRGAETSDLSRGEEWRLRRPVIEVVMVGGAWWGGAWGEDYMGVVCMEVDYKGLVCTSMEVG